MRFVDALARVPVAGQFAFTPDGRHVARITDRDGAFTVEGRFLGDGFPSVERIYGPEPSLSLDTQLSFLSADCLRICSARHGWFRIVEARRNTAWSAAGQWTAEPIVECEAATPQLLPRLEGVAWDLVISYEDGVSTIWRVDDDQPQMQLLDRIPGMLAGGAWLEPARTFVTNLIALDSGTASGYVIDLVAQTHHRLFHVSNDTNDRITLCDPHRGLLGVSSDCWGYRRPGFADLRNGRKVRFFTDLPGANRSADPCGFTGRWMILRRQHGVRTELWLADPADLSVAGPLDLPDGFVFSPVVEAGDRIRFAFSTPTMPTVCASYLPAKEPSHGTFRFEERPDLGELTNGDLVTPRVVSFHGPRGAIETLVFEPPSHRRRHLAVVAVHGGPVQQWSARFTSELQLFAGLGAVVAAPNYHGSPGYGEEFVRALEGAAGSVDLDDVVAVTTAIRDASGLEEPAILLYGHSYGAYLALLVAAAYPQLCDGVIAVAPFTSLSSMRTVGAPSVQWLVDQLWNPTSVEQQADLLHRCGDLRANLLIAHGGQDEVIPIQQSEMLCEQLRAQGYQDGRNLTFLSLPQEGHQNWGRAAMSRLYDHIESFLSHVEERSGAGRGWQAATPLRA